MTQMDADEGTSYGDGRSNLLDVLDCVSIGEDWRPALLGHFPRILLSFICVHLRSSADDCIVLIIRIDCSTFPPRPGT